MIRYCAVKNKKEYILLELKSSQNFYIHEAESQLKYVYPKSKVKCFVKREKAFNFLMKGD